MVSVLAGLRVVVLALLGVLGMSQAWANDKTIPQHSAAAMLTRCGPGWFYLPKAGSCIPGGNVPTVEGHGVKAFASEELVVIDTARDELRFSVPVGFGWDQRIAFQAVYSDTTALESRIVLEVGGVGARQRFFDLETGNELYVQEQNQRLVMSDQPEEQIAIELCLFGSFDCAKIRPIITVTKEWKGTDSKIRQPEYHRILTQADWDALWKRHRGENASSPSVNFSTQMVVAIFTGASGSSGLAAKAVEHEDDVVVYFYNRVYQSVTGHIEEVIPTPFGFFMLPRSSKKLIIKQRHESMIVPTGAWDTVKEFESL